MSIRRNTIIFERGEVLSTYPFLCQLWKVKNSCGAVLGVMVSFWLGWTVMLSNALITRGKTKTAVKTFSTLALAQKWARNWLKAEKGK